MGETKNGTIGQAVEWMRKGFSVQRAGWNGKGMWLHIQKPDSESDMDEPYVYMYNVQKKRIPWLCSQADLLATDWQTVE